MNQNFVMIFIILIFLIHILPGIRKSTISTVGSKVYARVIEKNEKRSKGNNKDIKFIMCMCVCVCVNTYTCI